MPLKDEKLQLAVDTIVEKLDPRSIFLYGSHSRAEAESGSNFEVGVIRRVGKNWHRHELFDILEKYPTIHGYAFDESSLRAGHVDAPYPETIFIRELIITGRTIHGEKVIESLKAPAITLIDLNNRIHFDMGVALTSLDAWRRHENRTAKDALIKSCLFGTRAYLIYKNNSFVPTFERVVIEARSHLSKDQFNTVENIFILRKKTNLAEQLIFDNLELLSLFREELEKAIDKSGDIIVLK
ncbi:MAG: hypothetical protein V1838_03445 [Patescibacteria group bacterium]